MNLRSYLYVSDYMIGIQISSFFNSSTSLPIFAICSKGAESYFSAHAGFKKQPERWSV
jgi:hypothetical protein